MNLLRHLRQKNFQGRSLVAEVRRIVGEESYAEIKLRPGHTFTEKLFLHLGGECGRCQHCGEPSKFRTLYSGYAPFCGKVCAGTATANNRVARTSANNINHDARLSSLFVKRVNVTSTGKLLSALQVLEPELYRRAEKAVAKYRAPMKQVLYHMFVAREIPTCRCGDSTSFRSITEGYRECCSKRCNDGSVSRSSSWFRETPLRVCRTRLRRPA